VNNYIEVFSDANVQHVEEIGSNNFDSSSAIMIDSRGNDADKSESRMVQKKKKINENNVQCNSNDGSRFMFSSPPSSRLRSRKRHNDASAFQCPSTNKKKTGGKK
jgi:hypothetical protein